MKIIHYTEAPAKEFDKLPAKGVTGRVLIGKDDGASNFCMRIFELAPDGHTPLHAHAWEHEIFFHSGSGSVYQNGEWVPVRAGNAVFIPRNQEHQIRNTGTDALTFVCLIPAGVPEL
ncbi:MAG: cupin domain-containing protein [Syntrophobacteraceae bacterium]|nr:cupin domain-containing protein [Syntrophobacteraceae bacterium]